MSAPGPQPGAELRLGDPLVVALMEVVDECGYQQASLPLIAARAGVDQQELERRFGSKEALTLCVFELGAAELRDRVGGAFASGGEWPASLRAAAWELARWIRENPAALRFGVLNVLGAEEMVLVRREELLRWAAGLVEAGREVALDARAVPDAAPLLAVGAIVELLRRRVDAELAASLHALVPGLLSLAVRPYLGEEAAAAELFIPPPEDFRR